MSFHVCNSDIKLDHLDQDVITKLLLYRVPSQPLAKNARDVSTRQSTCQQAQLISQLLSQFTQQPAGPASVSPLSTQSNKQAPSHASIRHHTVYPKTISSTNARQLQTHIAHTPISHLKRLLVKASGTACKASRLSGPHRAVCEDSSASMKGLRSLASLRWLFSSRSFVSWASLGSSPRCSACRSFLKEESDGSGDATGPQCAGIASHSVQNLCAQKHAGCTYCLQPCYKMAL